MSAQHRSLIVVPLVLALVILAGCSPPERFAEGPTPIPTLVPATEIPSALEPTEQPAFAVLSYPAQPPVAAVGQAIYDDECAQCHGADGTGSVPGSRNFRDLDYMRGEKPADFYIAVTEGRGDMPAYQELLSSDERWDVVFYVWRLSTDQTILDEGLKLYEANCASCHGEDGSGELLGSADFTDLRQMDNLAPRDLYLTVTQGRGSMPAWQSLLSQDERWAAIDYLRTFSYDPYLEEEVAIQPTSAVQPPETVGCPADQSNPLAWGDAEAIQAGQAIYQAQCEACHAVDGSGALPSAPDFTTQEVNSDLLAEPGRYYCSVAEGIGSMPAFGDSLEDEELWQVITFLESLAP